LGPAQAGAAQWPLTRGCGLLDRGEAGIEERLLAEARVGHEALDELGQTVADHGDDPEILVMHGEFDTKHRLVEPRVTLPSRPLLVWRAVREGVFAPEVREGLRSHNLTPDFAWEDDEHAGFTVRASHPHVAHMCIITHLDPPNLPHTAWGKASPGVSREFWILAKRERLVQVGYPPAKN